MRRLNLPAKQRLLPDAKEKILRVARQYRRLFHQESVPVATSPADADFVEDDF